MPKVNLLNTKMFEFSPLKFFWSFLDRKTKINILLTFLTTVAYSIISAVAPYFAKLQLDQLTQPGEPIYPLASPKLLLLAFFIVPFILILGRDLISELFENWVTNRLSNHFELESRKRIWDKLYDFDAGFLESERNDFLFSQAVDSMRVPNQVYNYLRRNLEVFVSLVTILPLLSFISPTLVVLVLVGALIQYYFTQVQFKEKLNDRLESDQLNREFERYHRALDTSFQELKQIGEAPSFLQKQIEKKQIGLDTEVRQNLRRARFNLRTDQIKDLIMLFVNVFVGYQVLEGKLSLGSFALVLSYTDQISRLFERITFAIEDWKQIDYDHFRLQFFLNLKSRWKKPSNPITLDETKEVRLEDVSFKYPDYYEEEKQYFDALKQKINSYLKSNPHSSYHRETLEQLEQLLKQPSEHETVLKQISLTLKRGSVTALVGRNGAGKTTITRLLMHHFEPNKGEILVNSTPLTKLDQQWLFHQFALITQNPLILYRFSLRENLLLGVEKDINEDEIWKVLKQLDLEKVIKKLPKGLDSVIGEDSRLSGGQEQLVALARVLLQRRPFIIMDEGTSQLDVEHEAKILKLLVNSARENNTGILFITHRITTARRADEILVMDKGKIAERGEHQDLIAKKGLYASFWQTQVME